MSLVKGAMLLLLLAVIGINAAPGPEDCDGLNKTLSAPDLHKIYGSWSLVWSVADSSAWTDSKGIHVLSSSTFELLPDNQTVVYTEKNHFINIPANQYVINMSKPTDSEHLLHIDAATLETEGVVAPYNQSGDVDFYESCDDCLVMDYRGTEARFLLIFRRKDSPMDPELLKASHSDHEKLADCLGLPHDKPFICEQAKGLPLAS